DRSTRNDYLYPSLGAHRFSTTDDFFPQVGLLHKRNIPGFNIFSLTHYGLKNLEELGKGVFRKTAYTPHKGVVPGIKLLLADTSDWLKKLSASENSLPSDNLQNMAFHFDKLENSLPYSNVTYYDYPQLKKRLEDLKL